MSGPAIERISAIPRDLRAVVKREMMRLPILSIGFRLAQFVPIDRADPVKARASIDAGARLLRAGLSFLAFPEGTRSRDGNLGVFKKGVFVMAILANHGSFEDTLQAPSKRTAVPDGTAIVRYR